MLIGLAILLLLTIAKHFSRYIPGMYLEAVAVAGGAAVVFVLYGLAPTIFWGVEQDDMMNGKDSPDNGQNFMNTVQPGSGKDPCGDGVCDQAERENPDLCPKDCP